MRAHALLREIIRNLTSGTSRLGALFFISTLALTVAVLSDVLTISRTVDDAIEYRGSGAAVMTLALPGRINGASCDALADTPNVLAAGAMRPEGKVTAGTLPGEPLDLYTTTPAFARVLGAEDGGSGVYVSTDVASNLGSTALPLTAGAPTPVRGTYPYPPDGRRAGFGWAVLSPTSASDGAFDECWVLSWPQRSDLRQLLLTSVTPAAAGAAASEQPIVSQLNTKYGLTFAGSTEYESRITRYAPYLAALVGFVLSAMAVWFRRVEIASNLHAGASRGTLYLQHLIESVAWSLPAVAAAWMAGFLTATITAPTELPSLALRSAEIALSFSVGTLTGTAFGFFLVREGRLGHYVKGR
ncbi:hypothetical protein KZC56_05490 [Microbacterium sp. SSW1-47]|uniref:hypothetical protein n=1 Tax=Microbacterium TaxID=33882 RepID=UPI00109BB386|nr:MULTISPECIES: hypothetical protein [Microbacterium]MBN6191423.1 hypothetical protein [Aneurinibacillus sp. BA2021]MCK2025745.1 hypothetical protein [Microbacterium sufflavum]